jgi:predicted nucleic acid-binding protein
MILLDTNIISELMKALPSPRVLDWVNSHVANQLFITSITIAEISYGLNVLPAGNRRSSLENAFNKVINEAFSHRILFFDESAAHQYGKVMAQRKEQGRPLSVLDGEIAAVAIAQGKILATRNTRDFIDCGLEVINPFEAT